METTKITPSPILEKVEKVEKPYKRIVILADITASVLIAVIAILIIISIVHGSKESAPAKQVFPSVTISKIKGFNFYYLSSSFSTDYQLQTNSISYTDGVIVFELKNPKGSVLAFSEEATPHNYDISDLQADVDFQTGYGPAFVTNATLRTTGALFTSDNTWILINSPTPIGSALMQSILNALKPYK